MPDLAVFTTPRMGFAKSVANVVMPVSHMQCLCNAATCTVLFVALHAGIGAQNLHVMQASCRARSAAEAQLLGRLHTSVEWLLLIT